MVSETLLPLPPHPTPIYLLLQNHVVGGTVGQLDPSEVLGCGNPSEESGWGLSSLWAG